MDSMWKVANLIFIFNLKIENNQTKYDLHYNPYSWNEIADVLYVEQPLRTGFSAPAKHAPKVYTEEDVGNDFRKFLLSFMQVFPEYKGIFALFISSFICR